MILFPLLYVKFFSNNPLLHKELALIKENISTHLGSLFFDYSLNKTRRMHFLTPQQLTHQKIVGIFWELNAPENFSLPKDDFTKVERNFLTNFAFPNLIVTYIKIKVLNMF